MSKLKVAAWGWQFQNEYPGEAGSPVDDTELPISEFWGKTNDGLNWQGVYDNHPAEFVDIASVLRAERDIYGKQGVEFKPWGVVRGQQPGWDLYEYARREGELAAMIAKAAAGPGEKAVYIVDLEPFYHGGPGNPQFFRNDLMPTEAIKAAVVRAFIEAFKKGGGQEIFIAPDARTAHLEPVGFRVWLEDPIVTLIMPQVYWTDFKQPPVTALTNAKQVLAGYGVVPERIVAVVPGNSTPADMEAGIGTAANLGFRGVSVWRRGTTPPAVWKAIAEMDDPWASVPGTPPVPHDVWTPQDRDDLGHARDRIEAVLKRHEERK